MEITALIISVVVFFISLVSLLWIFRKERTEDTSIILHVLTSVAIAIIFSLTYALWGTEGFM